MKPRILFDGRIFQQQQAGGINRYFAEIIRGLPDDWRPVVTGVKAWGAQVPAHPNLRMQAPPRILPFRYRQRFDRIWSKLHCLSNADLLHPTNFDLTCGLRLADFRCPVVVTVYDMIYIRFAQQMNNEAYVSSQRQAIRRADQVICISRSTERDVLEFIPEAAGKTSVIYLASSFPVSEPIFSTDIFSAPTFLYVGFRGGYKNFFFLLRAFAKAVSTSPGIRLVVVGPPLGPEERWQIYYLGITDKVTNVVFPDEATLQQLYRGSVAFLYPSRYEGFGIPPLEAMACGTVAVTSNTSSLPEVVGDAAIMLDPSDEKTWADCIVKLAQPFPGRDELLAKGRQRVGQFTWPECVEKHLEIYRKLLG
ncbi:MAG TPA: glycosyltransferase family 1 protein [Opitutales bacterium]|jgi:glycosyltransferase involved in cell wall biosynthesis|nr:glycosyltransferase family 1 protein [Opitutales bacterium]